MRCVWRAPPHAGLCTSGVVGCLGGSRCLHQIWRGRSLAYFAAACHYDYGSDAASDAVRDTVVRLYLAPRVSLGALRRSGGDARVLAFVGVSIENLVVDGRHLLEDVIRDLGLTWQTLLLLGFRPELLADSARFPLIVLHDLLGVRGDQFAAFFRSRTQLKACIGPREAAALGFRWNHWI